MAIRIDRFVKDSWLNVETLRDAVDLPFTTRIVRVYAKQIAKEMKLVLVLKGLDRHLPLNQTNLRTMQEADPKVQDALLWAGWEIALDIEEDIEVRGEQMAGIRLWITDMEVPEEMKQDAVTRRPIASWLKGDQPKGGGK